MSRADAIAAAPAIDFLAQATTHLRGRLDRSRSAGERIRTLWAAVVAARDLASHDIVEAEFMAVALDTGLARDLGRRADEDLRHVIRWALHDRNPFGGSK
jgi:hypothetical protein